MIALSGTFDAAGDVEEAVAALGDEGVGVEGEPAEAEGGGERDVDGEQPGERREKEAEEGGELGERGGDGEAFGLWSETRAEPLEGLGNPSFQQQNSTLNGPTPLPSGFATSSVLNSAILGLSGTSFSGGSSSQVFNNQPPQFASLLRDSKNHHVAVAPGNTLNQVRHLFLLINTERGNPGKTPLSGGNNTSDGVVIREDLNPRNPSSDATAFYHFTFHF
ncbi:hypothetical protein JHK86_009640 [Glycine max]|nr:hypothetical protein JHK86_009640 [Glycine max]